MGEESMANVWRVLDNHDCFPWIMDMQETLRLSDADCLDKTDIVIDVDPRFSDRLGGRKTVAVQVKSGFEDFEDVGKRTPTMLSLTPKRWRELDLVVLFGQQRDDSIAATLLVQIMNHQGIWDQAASQMKYNDQVRQFLAWQSASTRAMFDRFMAQDLVERGWEAILDFF